MVFPPQCGLDTFRRNLAEHVAAQADFLNIKLERVWTPPKRGKVRARDTGLDVTKSRPIRGFSYESRSIGARTSAHLRATLATQ